MWLSRYFIGELCDSVFYWGIVWLNRYFIGELCDSVDILLGNCVTQYFIGELCDSVDILLGNYVTQYIFYWGIMWLSGYFIGELCDSVDILLGNYVNQILNVSVSWPVVFIYLIYLITISCLYLLSVEWKMTECLFSGYMEVVVVYCENFVWRGLHNSVLPL